MFDARYAVRYSHKTYGAISMQRSGEESVSESDDSDTIDELCSPIIFKSFRRSINIQILVDNKVKGHGLKFLVAGYNTCKLIR